MQSVILTNEYYCSKSIAFNTDVYLKLLTRERERERVKTAAAAKLILYKNLIYQGPVVQN